MTGVVVPSWDMGQVIGTWRKLDGTLRPGKYKVTYPRVTNVTDDAIIPAGVFAEGDLNVQPGARSLDLSLPATDDPDNAEAAFIVTVAVSFDDAADETYNVAIPVGVTVNLREVIPAVSAIPLQQPHLKMGVPGGLAVLDAQGRVLDGDGDPITGGGSTVDGITDAGAVGKDVLRSISGAEARAAIGAGTSNLALGDTSSTAKAGDYVPAWSEIDDKPATFPPTIGATATTAVAGDDPRLSDARTPLGHAHTSAQITDFAEAAQDAVAALLAGASGVTLSYDDAANSLTITGGGSGGLDAEAVRDAMGVALIGAGLITVTVNDAADTITISTTATANSTDAALRDRTSHTGYQDISTVTGLQGALDGKVPTTRTVAGKPLSANVTIAKADVGLSNVDNTSDANKSFAASQITSGAFELDRSSPGLVFVVSWNGTAWTYNGATVTSRPTVRTDLRMIAVGGTAAPGFAITDDMWLEALA